MKLNFEVSFPYQVNDVLSLVEDIKKDIRINLWLSTHADIVQNDIDNQTIIKVTTITTNVKGAK